MPRVSYKPESPGRYRGIAAVGPWLCACIVLLLACGAAGAAGQTTVPKRIVANGAEFHYVASGTGEPLILLHGGQGDYRSMAAQAEALSPHYRVIAYSRRFHHPNDNPIPSDYGSGYPDAADLAALVDGLGLGRVHLVGTSAGALTALLFALEHPEKVRSLVLAEPPIHRWARDDAAGRPLYDAFMSGVWSPAGAAFRRGDDVAGMRALVDGFAGAPRFDGLPPAARAVALQNARFFRVATASPDPFPAVDKARVARLRMPVLIVTGERTVPLHRFVNEELAKVLPRAERATIAGAGHGAAREKPREFNAAVLGFLSRLGDPVAAPAPSAGQPADASMDQLRRQPR
jgi:pimeloyl-ACP methyl ester carboxylesterase